MKAPGKVRLSPSEMHWFSGEWSKHKGSPKLIAEALEWDVRKVYRWREAAATQGVILQTVDPRHVSLRYGWQAQMRPYRQRVDFTVTDGYVVIFGDCHVWPGEPSLATQALMKVCKQLKPKLIAANGDVMDGASISRHEPLGWAKLPTAEEELGAVRQFLGEVERATPGAKRFWSPGNHCTRFDRRLATEVPEFEGVQGFKLEDHFKDWPMAYVAVINAQATVPVLVMHNFRGGVHAAWNNTVYSGSTIVTGHHHSQQRTAHTDYFRTKYGVDHGVLQDPDHPAFSYTMGRPKGGSGWRAGFVALKMDARGEHYPPEFCEVQKYQDGYKRAVFRGEVICESACSDAEPPTLPSGSSRVRSSRKDQSDRASNQ